ncbi:hypothetical protein KC865_04090 [Candidatus Kaiserbacteria bacterium]|nr:hypothetical protein [Candidatus Kaiserbacteria bacterium]USN92277.1 MAG: hypothetical protein H6782_00420 [Candidatus Nomurabacteria bacterium]
MKYDYAENIDRKHEHSPKEEQQNRLGEAFENASIDVNKLYKIISKLNDDLPLNEEEREIIKLVNENERGKNN